MPNCQKPNKGAAPSQADTMPESDEYRAMLARAKARLPEAGSRRGRFNPPEADVLYEGKTTVWRNFADVVEVVRRDQQDMFQYMLRELGTSGNVDGRRALFKGRVVKKNIEDKLKAYLDAYVFCHECGAPDTKLAKEGRTLILRCEACGGHRPVAVRRVKKSSVDPRAIQEGKVYEVLIEDIGKKGDGVAKLGNLTIFVTGAPKGAELKIIIEKISGNIGYAKVFRE